MCAITSLLITTLARVRSASMYPEILDDTDEGKRVVDASGTPVGTIATVSEEMPQFEIVPEPAMHDRLAERFGWDPTTDVLPLSVDRIETVTDDEVQLAGAY